MPSPAEGGPDYRWSLANERTLLAYSRTAMALVVAGLAIAGSRSVADAPWGLAVLGLPLIAVGGAVAGAGYRRYRVVEDAMRAGRPLPPPAIASLLPPALLLVAAAGLVIAAADLIISG